jgi:general secretion pathway protein M
VKELLIDHRLPRKTIFVLGNVAICLVLVFGVLMPIWTPFSDRDARIVEQRKVLARLTAVAAQISNVEAIGSDVREELRRGEFLTGPNENVISADLQTRLKTLAGLSGAQSRAVQMLPARTIDEIKYCGARIEIVGPLQGILRSVHAIESAKPYLFITGAVMKSLPVAKQGGSEEPTLQAQLDVFGAMQVGEQP